MNPGTHSLRDRTKIRPPSKYDLNFVKYNDPTSFQDAISGTEGQNLKQAIQDELEAHHKNETWSIVPRIPGGRTIDSKWVFKTIQDSERGLRRFKARLCARGFKQKEGEDYHETFSPVVRYDSLRVLLAIVTQKDYEILQFDVRTAFLYGELQEDIHIYGDSRRSLNQPEEHQCRSQCSYFC